jgi:hypothetical protein
MVNYFQYLSKFKLVAIYKDMNIIKARLRKYAENEELIFKHFTATKFTAISGLFALVAFTLTYILLKIDIIFFEVHGYSFQTITPDVYIDYVFKNLWDVFPLIILVFVLIYICGYYIAIVMMRPFKVIGDHCSERMNNETKFYQADFFSDLKLLTSFSAFFFGKIDEAKVKGHLGKVEIPEDFTNIHKPIYEKNFFVSYLLLVTMFSLLASLGILLLNNEIRDQVLELSSRLVRNSNQVKTFLDRQTEIESLAINALLLLHVIVNIIFGMHLYQKIASPAFAVFATLRSFLKGNFHNRIHLIGFYYLRNDCRKINKYLDQIQKELT